MRRKALVWLFPLLLLGQTEVTVRLHWLHPKDKNARTTPIKLEEYVAGVLAGECAGFVSEEALKAMAVAARTYAVRYRGRHRGEGFDFCDTTHCQDLRLAGITDRLRAAAEATEGELLWFHGTPAAAYYHRHCGGTTEAARYVWPEAVAPYLIQQQDSFCVSRGEGGWSSQIGAADLRLALEQAGLKPPSSAASVRVLERTPSGRAAALLIEELRLTASDFHLAVGRTLGWDIVRSGFYEVANVGDRLVFRGRGSGHGVGLCQTGADRRGEGGHTHRQILAFYYPGTVLGVTAQGFVWTRMAGERVEVLSTRESVDRPVVELADRSLAEAERRAGFALSFRARLRVYPTVAAFRDATGEPGWVAASTRGGTVRLQPPPVLRSAGALESTLRHEMLHLLVESRSHPRIPIWFREGLALYLAEPDRPAGATRDVSEAALTEPRSAAEMKRAYEAARSRVRALVDRHGRDAVMSWLERGLPGGL